MLRHVVLAAAAAAFAFFASTLSAPAGTTCSSCMRTVPLVTPVPLLPYDPSHPVIDYRPAINAAGNTIVFERQFFDTSKDSSGKPKNTYLLPNLFIADLASRSVVALAPTVLGSARADWCWRPGQWREDGPITFSQGDNGPVFVMPPRAGATPVGVGNTAKSIYPTWYPGCAALAVDTADEIVGPTVNGPGTRKIDAPSGKMQKLVTGTTLWAGFPSVNWEHPDVLAFAGQQFTLNNPAAACKPGYDQDCNYVYIADSTGTPSRIYPLDRNAPVNMYNPDYQGRAPTWSPDGRWIAFESNRACIKAPVSDGSLYQIYIQDSAGLAPARPVTDCKYNAQHAKWYRHAVRGRALLVVTVLAYPGPPDGTPGHPLARKISSLDVTAFVAR